MNISEEQINKLFELASMDKKEVSKITDKDISEALIKIERKIYSFTSGIKIDSMEDKRILIADDLELSIYQLSTVLKKIGIMPNVTRNKEEAKCELQKVHFDCVIVDLFMPDSSDGLELIEEVVKRRNETGHYCKIIVISGTDEAELIDECYEKGADFYIQKDKDWHAKLLKYLSTSFQKDNSIAFSRYIINNNIVSYVLKKLGSPKIFDLIVKNINSSIFSGIKNVLFDLKEITSFEPDNAYIFADVYKLCMENGGKFIIINTPPCVKEALSFAYLDDMIPYAASIEEAVHIINNSDNIDNNQEETIQLN